MTAAQQRDMIPKAADMQINQFLTVTALFCSHAIKHRRACWIRGAQMRCKAAKNTATLFL